MKFFISIILTALVSFAACLFLPWWTIAIISFIIAAIIPQKPLASFFAGFIALFLLWCILSAVISNVNKHILAQKVAMIVLKNNNATLLIWNR